VNEIEAEGRKKLQIFAVPLTLPEKMIILL